MDTDRELRRIIDEGMRAAGPDPAAHSRMLSGLLARLPEGSGGPGGGAEATPTLAKASVASATTKLVTLGVAASAALVLALGRGEPTPQVPAAPVIAAVREAPTEPSPVVATLPDDPPRAPQRVAPVAPSRRPPGQRPAAASEVATADAIEAELALVSEAEAALATGDTTRALALTADHARTHAHGQLALEREAIAAAARCVAGLPDAAARARAFVDAHPRDAATAKVRARCAKILAEP